MHRDLKPSNILLTADGVPKVSDFGLAKLLDADSGRTISGEPVGTPSYMAPEQAAGQAKRVGPAADVYALGAILYESLTGRPPFLGESALETIKMVTASEVVAPRKLRAEVPRDLETICLKCLEKRQNDRYPTAVKLAEDLRRFLDGRPILARPVNPAGRLWRWCRRNPKLAGLAATLLLTFAVGTPALLALWLRARADRSRAESEAAISKAVTEFVQSDMLGQASSYNQGTPFTKPDPDLKLRTALDRAAEKIGERFVDQPLVEASIRQTVGETYHQLGLYRQALSHLQRALELRRGILGPGDSDTLLAMKAMGSVYLADGKVSEAEPLLVGAMEGLRKSRDSQHPDVVDAVGLVGLLYYTQGRLAEAENLLTGAREAHLARGGADDPKAIDVTNNLALVYMDQKKLELAEQTLSDVQHRSQRVLGAEHPVTLIAKQNLSDVRLRIGEKDEAARSLIEVIASQRKVIGPKHPETLQSMVQLGLLYASRGAFENAEPLLSEALAGCREALDRNHETTVAAIAGLLNVYVSKKDIKRLGLFLVEAAEITRAGWGLDHPSSAWANLSAGRFFLGQRDYAKAERYLHDGLTCWRKRYPGHRERYSYELQYGVSLLAQRKCAEAQSPLLEGYNGLRPDRENAPTRDNADLGWLIQQVCRLRDANGKPMSETILAIIRKDANVEAIVLDLQFPAEPFARPETVARRR